MAETRDYRDWLDESLQDADEAAAYLDAALEDGNPEGFVERAKAYWRGH